MPDLTDDLIVGRRIMAIRRMNPVEIALLNCGAWLEATKSPPPDVLELDDGTRLVTISFGTHPKPAWLPTGALLVLPTEGEPYVVRTTEARKPPA